MPDPVLDPGAGPVPSFQERQLPERRLGDERLVDPPFGLLEQGQLRARVRAFAAHDEPHPDGPVGQVEQPAQFRDVAAGAHATILDREHPGRRRNPGDGLADRARDREPVRVLEPAPADLVLLGEPVHQSVGGSGTIGADQQVPAVGAGTWAMASDSTWM